MQQGRRDRRGIISDIIGDIGDIGDIGAPTWVVDAGAGFGSYLICHSEATVAAER